METTEEIRQKLDIVDLVGEYVKLKPSGGSNFKACCPFHREKTPSFHVSRDKQLWYCFGCGEGGDHFAFLMKMEGVDFTDALRELAEKTGVEIKRFSTEDANSKTRILKVMDIAVKFYHKYLLDIGSAVTARDYLALRGLTEDLIEKFKLGYAPDRWDSLTLFLKKAGFSDQEIIDAGLAVRRQDGKGIYDRFRHRVMFPIFDTAGRPVGFTGRLLDEKRDEGKYVNTPQTLIYNKSHILYGLNLAKTAIKNSGAVVMVEGNMDVIASHKAGIEAVVASSGTALTREQLVTLRRFTETILICFDADAAGENAAKRGIDLALEEGINIKVVTLPKGVKDPDDLVKKDSAEWQRVIAEARDIMTYYFEKTFSRGLPVTAIQKKQIGRTLLPEIARLQDPIERAHWLRELSTKLGVTESILEETMNKIKLTVRPEKAMDAPKQALKSTQDRRVLLAEKFLTLLLARDDMVSKFIDLVRPELLIEPYRALYVIFGTVYHDWQRRGEEKSQFFRDFRRNLEENLPESLGIIDRLLFLTDEYKEKPAAEIYGEFDHILAPLKDYSAREIREIIARELKDAELSGDKAKMDELIKKFNESV